MREIKFRAWDKKTNKMYYTFNPVCHGEWNFFEFNSAYHAFYKQEWGKAELMQYTGLKDKNGKEIYEGDIVEGICAEYHPPEICSTPEVISECRGEVYFNRGAFEIKEAEFTPDIYDLEIIGNIYENPEFGV